MFDYVCPHCGQKVSADPKNYWYDQDGDTVEGKFQLTCPICGVLSIGREIFRWDGITHIE